MEQQTGNNNKSLEYKGNHDGEIFPHSTISIANTIKQNRKILGPKFRDNWNQQFSQSHYEVTGEFFSHLYGLLLLLWMFYVGLRSDVARIQSCSYWNFNMLLSCCSQHSPFNFNFYSIYGFFSFFILYFTTQIICSLDLIVWHLCAFESETH